MEVLVVGDWVGGRVILCTLLTPTFPFAEAPACNGVAMKLWAEAEATKLAQAMTEAVGVATGD